MNKVAVGVLLAAIGCGETECLLPPCVQPLALEVTVTSATTGAAVAGVSMAYTGPYMGAGPCVASKCVVPGTAGRYEIDISAPGYQTVHRSITVPGTDPECGCPTAETQRLTIALPGA